MPYSARSGLISLNGSHLAVGVGSVRGEVLVGDVRNRRSLSCCRSTYLRHLLLSLLRGPVTMSRRPSSPLSPCWRCATWFLPPGHRRLRLAQGWAAGNEVDRAAALKDTYAYARRPVSRLVAVHAVLSAALLVVVGAVAGASWSRLAQYAILGASVGIAVQLIAVHSVVEGALRPVRVALAGDTGIGDSLPRSRPTFAAWSNLSMLLVAFAFAAGRRDAGGRVQVGPPSSPCSGS